jgi:pyruvate kinase
MTRPWMRKLQNFACKHGMDFVAISFVQTMDDVLTVRKVLDEAGGKHIKIISKIENQVCSYMTCCLDVDAPYFHC